ncbi:MAG: S41 family peptidase [Planctomycetes bacterium]|nr:S41 family peptidase [Planctomycetota bacterium]
MGIRRANLGDALRAWLPAAALALCAGAASPCGAEDASAYLEDLDFLQKTVGERSISLARLRFDWRFVCEDSRDAFRTCPDDRTHAENVMLLLANLDEAQARVTPHTVPSEELPQFAGGLEDGGLWLEVHEGQVYLRGSAPDHPLAKTVPPGSALIELQGEPMWLVLERLRRSIATWFGITSEQSLWARLDGGILDFGERDALAATFLTPSGETVAAVIPRKSAGGAPFPPRNAGLPDRAGEPAAAGVEAGVLARSWCEKLAVVRLGATVDAAAVEAFDSAFDPLEGAQALIVDLRGTGGTGSAAAAAIAGRFHGKEAALYRDLTIAPRGKWQHAGPIVVLQDGATREAAELLLEALIATGRTITIGAASGGWTLRTESFRCPSGKLSFALGTAAAETVLRESRPYAAGTPPDIVVPRGPAYAALPDPAFELGLQVLELWLRQRSRERAGAFFARLYGEGDIDRFLEENKAAAAELPGFDAAARGAEARANLTAIAAMELALLEGITAVPPDFRGIVRRSRAHLPRLRAAGCRDEATALSRALRGGLHVEVSAQSALLDALDRRLHATPERASKFLRRYEETRIAAYARKYLFEPERR